MIHCALAPAFACKERASIPISSVEADGSRGTGRRIARDFASEEGGVRRFNSTSQDRGMECPGALLKEPRWPLNLEWSIFALVDRAAIFETIETDNPRAP